MGCRTGKGGKVQIPQGSLPAGARCSTRVAAEQEKECELQCGCTGAADGARDDRLGKSGDAGLPKQRRPGIGSVHTYILAEDRANQCAVGKTIAVTRQQTLVRRVAGKGKGKRENGMGADEATKARARRPRCTQDDLGGGLFSFCLFFSLLSVSTEAWKMPFPAHNRASDGIRYATAGLR